MFVFFSPEYDAMAREIQKQPDRLDTTRWERTLCLCCTR